MHKKYKDVKVFFKEKLGEYKISSNLTKDLKNFRLDWSTKDSDYIDFLGSNLLGVHNINFSILDDDKLMNVVLKIKDYKELQSEIYLVKDIEKNFKIGSNIIYQTLMYIAYLYHTDKKMNHREKEAGIKELCLIMQFKMFSSIYGHYFKWRPSEAIATAVYNKLSHKFLIKQLGTWQEVFEFRASSCLDKRELNYKRLNKYDSETSVRLITDIQIKLKEQIKHIYKVLVDITENKEGIIQESSTFVGGENGDEQIVDLTGGIGSYINNVKTIAFIPNDFLDSELITIVSSLFKNVNRDLIYTFLKYMSDNDKKDAKDIIEYIEKSLLITFNYLQRNNVNIEKREYLPKALMMIRNFWAASKVKNEEMIDVKEFLVKEAFKCTGKKTNWVNVTLALSYVVYIFLRSLKK